MNLPTQNFRLWQAPDESMKIELHETVLEALRVSVGLQLSRNRLADLNQRGALLGSRVGSVVSLTGCTMPGVRLSPEQQSSIVGWYAIRSAKNICLLPEEIDVLKESPSGAPEIAFIIRPSDKDAIRIGVFFQEASGVIRAESSYREVLVVAPRPVPQQQAPAPIPPRSDYRS